MRIVLSIHHVLDENAGAAGATMRLAEALRNEGHDVRILSFDDLRGPAETKRFRFPWQLPALIASAGHVDVADLSSGDGWLLAGLDRLRSGAKVPLVVARSHGLEHTADLVTREEARQRGEKLSWKYPIYNGGFRLWECAQAFRSAGLSLFLNQADLDYAVSRLGVGRSRARLTTNGLAAHFTAVAHELSRAAIPTKRNNIAFIGSFIKRKGIDVLRDAMNDVVLRHPDATLGLFGTGTTESEVLRHFPEHLQAHISVVPRYRNLDLPRLLGRYQILAFSSLSEGRALTPAEAMACGLVPVVSSAPGAHEFVLDGTTGLITPATDAAELARGICHLIENAEEWQAMRASALRAVQAFSWKAVARQTLDLYREFL